VIPKVGKAQSDFTPSMANTSDTYPFQICNTFAVVIVSEGQKRENLSKGFRRQTRYRGKYVVTTAFQLLSYLLRCLDFIVNGFTKMVVCRGWACVHGWDGVAGHGDATAFMLFTFTTGVTGCDRM
jgi:hypothetical protein